MSGILYVYVSTHSTIPALVKVALLCFRFQFWLAKMGPVDVEIID